MRSVPLRCIKKGSLLAKDLYDNTGSIFLKEGIELTDELIEEAIDNGFHCVYILDDYSNNEIDNIKSELKIRLTTAVKEAFKKIEYNNMDENLIDEIVSQRDIMINLVDIKNMDKYVYEHSVNVAILSLVLGIELGLNRNELYILCIGALLHDIGKAFIPYDICSKNPLTEAEEEVLKTHTTKGYEYLKDLLERNLPSRIICLEHHERIDGYGYPNKINGDKINKLSKIVAIVNTYDHIRSHTPCKSAQPPNDAIEYLMGSAGRHFDYDMVKIFIKNINPYPIGTLVRLSNKEIGIVEDINENYPLRPKVRIIKQLATTVEMKVIDLLKEKNLVIEGIQREIPNLSVQHYLKSK